MISHLLVKKKGGKIFVNAAGGDNQEEVRRRAARIALKKEENVNFEIINSDPQQYQKLTPKEAKRIMTAKMWREELSNCFADPLTRKEASTLTKQTKRKIVNILNKERKNLDISRQEAEKDILKVEKALGL